MTNAQSFLTSKSDCFLWLILIHPTKLKIRAPQHSLAGFQTPQVALPSCDTS